MRRPLLAVLPLLCAACAPIGPDYRRPDAPALPADWKTAPGWRAARPADDQPKQDWWKAFGDSTLDELIARSLKSSPTLQLSLARYDQALAQRGAREAALLPTVALGAAASRNQISANRPLTNYAIPNSSTIQNDYRPTLSVSYELDWLGRVRRDVESARASAEQARADAENVRLLLTAQVAQAYFQLRQLDEEIRYVGEAVKLQTRVLELIRARHELGAAGQTDVVQQTALLEASQAQLELLGNQRNQVEDQLGTLTGTAAAGFRLAPGRLPAQVPEVPAGLPADVLERRPDIAAAERAMAAANAQIGVARAAFFPSLTLAPALAGYESNALNTLTAAPSLIWSLGVFASQTLFDGGRIRAGVDLAEAGYAGTVAAYRQTVLTAVQEAQDALGGVQRLAAASTRQREAVRNQQRAYELGLLRYKEGLDNALSLATVEQNQLAAQRVQSQIDGARFAATVGLIKAIGGNWRAAN